MAIDITVSLVLRLLLAFIFVHAAWHKVSNYQHFVSQLTNYRLLPELLVPALSIFLPLMEISLVVALLVTSWMYPSVVAAAVLAIYAVAMSINLAQGRNHLDCGCNGPRGNSQSISWALVSRNCVLAILALATALPVTARSLSLQDISTVVLASSAVILIYASIEQAIANQQRQANYFALTANDSAGALE